MKATEVIPPINDLSDMDIIDQFRMQAATLAASRPPDIVNPVSLKPKARKTYTKKTPKLSNDNLDDL